MDSDSSDLDSVEAAILAEAALEACSVDRRARLQPAFLEDEVGFASALEAQFDHAADDAARDELACAAYFEGADAGHYVRCPRGHMQRTFFRATFCRQVTDWLGIGIEHVIYDSPPCTACAAVVGVASGQGAAEEAPTNP